MGTPYEGDVVNEHAEEEFALTSLIGPRRKGRSEPTFVLDEGAFELPSLAVPVFREVGGHFAPVFAFRRFFAGSAAARRDDALGPEHLSDKRVIAFGIVARIGDQPIKRQKLVRGEHRLGELGVVRQRADVRDRRDKQVALGVGDDAELGKMAFFEPATLPVIRARVSALVAGRVYSRQLGALANDAALARCRPGGAQEPCEAPFFRSRSSA